MNPGGTGTPPTTNPGGGTGSSIVANPAPDSSSNTRNLSTEGTLDWDHWGEATLYQKSITANPRLIGALGTVSPNGLPPPVPFQYSNDARTLQWGSDIAGGQAGSSTNTLGLTGAGNSFEFTVPADPAVRTLTLHLGGMRCSNT